MLKRGAGGKNQATAGNDQWQKASAARLAAAWRVVAYGRAMTPALKSGISVSAGNARRARRAALSGEKLIVAKHNQIMFGQRRGSSVGGIALRKTPRMLFNARCTALAVYLLRLAARRRLRDRTRIAATLPARPHQHSEKRRRKPASGGGKMSKSGMSRWHDVMAASARVALGMAAAARHGQRTTAWQAAAAAMAVSAAWRGGHRRRRRCCGRRKSGDIKSASLTRAAALRVARVRRSAFMVRQVRRGITRARHHRRAALTRVWRRIVRAAMRRARRAKTRVLAAAKSAGIHHDGGRFSNNGKKQYHGVSSVAACGA